MGFLDVLVAITLSPCFCRPGCARHGATTEPVAQNADLWVVGFLGLLVPILHGVPRVHRRAATVACSGLLLGIVLFILLWVIAPTVETSPAINPILLSD